MWNHVWKFLLNKLKNEVSFRNKFEEVKSTGANATTNGVTQQMCNL